MRAGSFAETFHLEHSLIFTRKQKEKIGSRRSRRRHVFYKSIKEETGASVKVA
jgi:hypothetical protein